ncbi:MAG TPA: hypothetical protein DEU95_02950 [Chloroflexi bacterium]|nr:hypothetical protein [Chloroflexota bacterium]HBY46287.1 hypothetical protein [Chloroflexota bacterium]HCG28711.1 hypothetical protein [Chloroflexota bacterium]HRA31800.1 DUF5615 family PIN-like protein [Thermomicrobiales bacterium]
MVAFLIDEDMPRSTARVLREAGYAAEDVRDVGLRGHSDADVFAYAQEHSFTVITADLGFANPLTYPLGSHAGIVVVRVPNEVSVARLNDELARALEELRNEELAGLLVIVEPGRMRIRRPPGPFIG